MKRKVIIALFLAGNVPLIAQTNKDKKVIVKDTARETQIKEVIVTSSYGTRKLKEELVGSISTISAKDIPVTQAFESLDKMIAGLSPGVQVVTNPELGKPVDINIRGLGTMVGLNSKPGTSTQPLIIIDGIIMKEDRAFDDLNFDGGTNSEMLLNPLARLSTDNVETINILKDAAAVALYGADAANGVIIITTKKGIRGKPKFSLSSQYGISTSINKVKYLSGEQYAQVYDAYQRNNGSTAGHTWNGADVDWFEVMNQPGDFFKTNFGVSGGKKNFNYRIGLDYSKNNESKILNSLEKKGIDATLGLDFNKVKINLYGAYNAFDKNNPNTYFNFILAPTFPIYNKDGDYNSTGYFGIPNPLAAANQNISKINNKSLLSSINISYNPFKNLKLSSIFGVDWSKKDETNWRSGLNESGRFSGTFVKDGKTYGKFGRSRLSYSDALKWNWSAQAYYEKNFATKHHSDILVGMELRSTRDYKTNETGSNYVNPYVYQLPKEAAQYTTNNGDVYGYSIKNLTVEDAGRSLFTQVNYDFLKKYFFSGTIRRDESSAFGSDKNAAYNGGIGLSWIISKEKFLEKSSWINFLKLRTSWGMTGNSRIGSYRSSGLYAINQNGFIYDYDYVYPNTSAPPNKELGWEKNEKYNLGIDFNLFRKFEFTIEFFRNNLSNMIVSRDVPAETGYNSAEINGAAMYNQGVEFSARANWIRKKDFTWVSKFNISTVKNKVTDLIGFGDDYSPATLARAQKIGSSTSAIWGYKWLGVNPQNGLDMYLVAGVPKDSNAFTSSPLTYEILGNSQPDASGGFSNNIIYKNFNLSFLFNFEIGGSKLIIGELVDQYRILLNRNMSINAIDYWKGPGDTSAVNHIPNRFNRIVSNSTKFLYDNTHIKLQNINFGYKIPLERGKNDFIKDANIFIDCTNVWYWYKEKSPENRNGIREFRYLYPEMRTLSFGFRLNF